MTENRSKGGKRAAEKLLAKDPDYFKKLGSRGGSVTKTKPNGWAYLKIHDPERLAELGRRGGLKSRRTK